MHKHSQSVTESRENGVFLRRLYVIKAIVSVGHNMTDTIKDIWVENMWMYNEQGRIVKDSAKQLLILFGKASEKYDDNFVLKSGNDYFGWNGVFFNSYSNLRDSIFVVSMEADGPSVKDTIILK